MSDEQAQKLYSELVMVCQQYGFTTEHTYELLQHVVDSLEVDAEQLA